MRLGDRLRTRRTVSSTISDLMEKLGVRNRFQLGVALGAKHIVPALGGLLSPTSLEEER